MLVCSIHATPSSHRTRRRGHSYRRWYLHRRPVRTRGLAVRTRRESRRPRGSPCRRHGAAGHRSSQSRGAHTARRGARTVLPPPQAPCAGQTLLVPGVQSMGIAEPRLMALAGDLAGSGIAVMTIELPDLMGYQITARSADVIEDAVAWIVAKPDLAPDGRVGMVGISFAGGLSIVAAGRPMIRDKVAYVVSLGGHGDLGRVLHYLTTGRSGPGPWRRDAPAPRLRRRGHPARRCRPCRPSRAGGSAARGHRHVPAGVAVDTGQRGPGECHVSDGP